ncbi:MAG: selenocysteine-specific translation elongation factor [Deltaproteobacteria bacterium]
MILGTAGHIDHGKTTLVRALTGVDTDRLPEEKRRGITIELGFAPLTLDGFGTIGVVDVPGHEAFVRTMVAGATGIDLALVVIAADEGVMPQTREHLAILDLLGVRRGVIAITKADLVDAEWLALVEEDVRSATAATLPDAPVIPTSAHTGQGIARLREALAESARSIPARGDDDLFRLPVDRAFTIKGTGTVVTGTVWSGRLSRDETVRILPGDRTARVRGIQGHGSQLDVALPGGRTAVALAGVDVADIPRGSTIVTDRDWRTTTLARADVVLVTGVEIDLRPRTWFRLHVGTTEVGARVVARTVDHDRPFAARLVLDAPALLRAGDRFVLRTSAPLNTIGGGVITDPYAPRRARPWRPRMSERDRLAQLVDEAGGDGVELSSLAVRLGSSPRAAQRQAQGGDFSVVSSRVVSSATLAAFESELLATAVRYHREHPLEPGMPTQLLRSSLRGSPEVVGAAVQAQLAAGRIVAVGSAIAVNGWAPKLDAVGERTAADVVARLEAAGSEPPSLEELTTELGQDPSPVLRFLERRGDVVQVEQNRYYMTAHLTRLVDRLRAAMQGGAETGPAELREKLGLSRKFLIPLLEYCDRVGHTDRKPGGRVWRGT